MALPKISVIIPTYGEERRKKLDSLLSEIEEQDYESREVLVIDGRGGQGKAINRGAASAAGEILFILDDDTSLGHTDLFRNMVKVLESDKKVGMVGASTISRPDDSLFQKMAIMQVPRRYFPVVDTITESDMVHHPCCAIPKRVFEEIGGENEILIRGLDPDLRYRIRKKGYKIVIAPNSWIYHPLPESMWGIFKMYFKNGQGAAFAYLIDPDLVYEVADIYQGLPTPQKTSLAYRMFRFIKRFLWNIITFKMIKIIAMAAYGLGYITGFFIYRKSMARTRKERAIYNIRRFFATAKEVSGIIIKEVLFKRENLFRQYLIDRLVLYDVGGLAARYASNTTLWIHANTLGDVNNAAELSRILTSNLPDIVIIVSTTELAAYKIAKDINEFNEVKFLPFDLPFLVNNIFKRLKPKLFITIEIILWPNLIMELNKLGIKTMLANGGRWRYLDNASVDYMISRELLKYFVNKVDAFTTYSKEEANELIALGVSEKKITVAGHFRLDRQVNFSSRDEKIEILKSLFLNEDADIIIAGNIWAGEEELFLKVFKDVLIKHPSFIMLIAPRQMKWVDGICSLIRKMGIIPKRKSRLSSETAHRGEVIVIDTLGELNKLYGMARLSIIGSSFIEYPGGGNIAEPLFRGSPVISGPYIWFSDKAIEDMNIKIARSYEELKEAVGYFLDNPNDAIASRDRSLEVIKGYKGAYAMCAKTIQNLL